MEMKPHRRLLLLLHILQEFFFLKKVTNIIKLPQGKRLDCTRAYMSSSSRSLNNLQQDIETGRLVPGASNKLLLLCMKPAE
jgi:hypothetical protein